MVNDPCSLVPDMHMPAGLPRHPAHVVHHVIGRIRHTVAVHAPRKVPAPDTGIMGCEKHASNLARIHDPVIRVLNLPKILILGSAGVTIATLGSIMFVVLPYEARSSPGPSGRVHVPEPSSLILYACAVLAVGLSRRLRSSRARTT